MTDQDKIQEALIVAMQALPERDHDPDHASDPETYRVCLSADVTARCRELGLLTPQQFVCYEARYMPDASWGPTMLYPSVREEGTPTALGRAPQMPDRSYVPVPVSEELRKEFLGINDPHHDLARHDLTVHHRLSGRSAVDH